MLEFQTPQITAEKTEDNRGTFTIEPLDRGFGYTFGNSLRRVLLSSLAGAAVTSVRIEGVAHEFSTISGVKEDVTDIVLNLKEVVARMHSDAAEIEVPLVATGPGEVTAGDIDLPSGVELLNPEAHIATLEKKTKLEMYLTIGRGRGYSPAEDNKSAGSADRRHPDRLDLLAGQARGLPGRVRACRPAHRLRQADARHRDRRLRGAAGGGFSYGDYLRSGAMAAKSPVMRAVIAHAERGGLVLGICNGFQVLTETRLLPGALAAQRGPEIRLQGRAARDRQRQHALSPAPIAKRARPTIPIAHGDGRYVADEDTLDRLEGEGRVVFRYLDNPNGSARDIAGIINERGNVMGMMPHPERASDPALGRTGGAAVFQSLLEAA